MRELLTILALSAALPFVGVAPTTAASPVSMSWRAGAYDALAADVDSDEGRRDGRIGPAPRRDERRRRGNELRLPLRWRRDGRKGSGGGTGGGGGINGSGGGAGTLLPLFDPQKNCPRHRRKGQSDECWDDE